MQVGLGFTQADADQLIALGLISPVLDQGKTNVVSESKPTEQLGGFVDLEAAQSRYKVAYPLATKLTASMGFCVFRLNLAVEAAGSYSQLVELFPKIKDAAGFEKSLALRNALRGRGRVLSCIFD
jgi:hypothetical protein